MSAPTGTDPETRLFAQSTFDLLLIELVPMAQRIASQIHAADQLAIHGNHAPPPPAEEDDDHLREAVYYRLERLGYRVGLGLIESLTVSYPLLSRTDPLDTLKFIAKDLWLSVFRKQIDNLKTNHRGVFVLTDNTFYPLRRASLTAGSGQSLAEKCRPFLWFPSGLIKGALTGAGWEVETVRAEVGGTAGAGAVFTIRLGAGQPGTTTLPVR